MALPGITGKVLRIRGPYTNGICYYNLFLNPDNSYSVIRNAFYKATVTDILALGNPDPYPQNPEEPIETATTISVDIQVEPWTMVEWETPLKP